jgi:hypothetical protein
MICEMWLPHPPQVALSVLGENNVSLALICQLETYKS